MAYDPSSEGFGERSTRAVYVISVAAELAGVHPQTLRIYERKGLLDPARTGGGNRRYSEADIAHLRRIQQLTAAGLNLEGVRRVMALEIEISRLRAELEMTRAGCTRGDRADPPPVPARSRAGLDHPPAGQADDRKVAGRAGPSPAARTRVDSRITREMTLDPNRWTLKTQEAVRDAIALAKDQHNAEVAPDHLLSAALSQDGGVAIPLLDSLGMAPLSVRNRIAESLARVPKAYGISEPSLSRELSQAFERADVARKEMGDEYLSVEHLLLALSDRLGVGREDLLRALQAVRGSHRVTSQSPEEQYQSLETLRP